MNRISIFFIIVSLVTSFNLMAQKDPLNAGDKYFKEYQYHEAEEQYGLALLEQPDNPYLYFQLGEVNRLVFDYNAAEGYYKKALEKDVTAYPLAQYYYAEMLKLNGDYDKALVQFNLFLESPHSDKEINEFHDKALNEVEGCLLAQEELKKPIQNYHFKLMPAPVNSPYTEFSPAIYKNDTTMMFTSTRSDEVAAEDYVFGSLKSRQFVATGKDLTWVVNPIEELNTEGFNDKVGSFTADYKSYYFTRCDQKVKSKQYVDYFCAIYKSEREGETWGEPELLNGNINPEGTFNAQPAISPNGDTLFFMSKREGGKGMHDIWYSTRSNGGEWGSAINLEAINTPYIDMSPCFDSKDGYLFYASNGRPGFGGLDIYKAHGENFTSVENIGLPFNSNKDDFYFVVGDSIGFLSSNRDGGLGADDLYTFTKEAGTDALVAKTHVEIDSTSSSETISGKIKVTDDVVRVEDVLVVLTDSEENHLKTTKSNEEGNFRFENLEPGDYNIYIEEKNGVDLVHGGHVIVEDLNVALSADTVYKVLFENIYFDFDKSDLRPEAKKTLDDLIAYYNQNQKIQIEMNANTDNIGSQKYNQILSKNRGNAAYNYLISNGVDRSAIVINARGSDDPLASNSNAVGRQLNRRVEFHILGGQQSYVSSTMTYIIEPNQTLSSVAKRFDMSVEELRALNNLSNSNLQAYKPLRVRNTGDNDLIDPITMKRGNQKMNKKYKKAQGKRISSYNSSVKKYDENVVLTEQQKNEGFDLYVVKKQNTLFSIARLYGMEVSKLKELNNVSSDTIYTGQRLKVVRYGTPVPDKYYLVEYGDDIRKICAKVGIKPEELIELNAIEGYSVKAGMILKIAD